MPGLRLGDVYYVNVPEDGLKHHECRDNPDGPRPWMVVSKPVRATGVLVAIPLRTKPACKAPTHLSVTSDQFEAPHEEHGRELSGYLVLEQIRALDKERFQFDALVGRAGAELARTVRTRLRAMFGAR